MAEDVRIGNALKMDSDARVILELMFHVGSMESETVGKDKRKSREYWLDLYSECWHAVKFGQRRDK